VAMCMLLMAITSSQREINVIKWPELQEYINQKNDTIKIIHFWATWCKPCMEEMPDFEKIHQHYNNQKVEVLLVSLDQVALKEKVVTSLSKKGITAKVALLDEVDFNKWIDRVDSTWSGAIPATLIVKTNSNYKKFYEKQFSYQELKNLIESLNP